MSDPGMPSPQPVQPPMPPMPPGPTAAPPKRSALGTVVLVLSLLLIIGGGGVLAFTLITKDTKHTGIVFPKKWDSRILPFAMIAEKERGLKFKHPVTVNFLAPQAFEKTLTADSKDLTKRQKKEIQQSEALFRAFGLLDGSVNLFDAVNSAQGSGTLAYYSFDTKTITVRGSSLTLASHATLVHELTHVLQDQWYDVGFRLTALQKKQDKGEPSTAYDALDAVVEGDAERTADLYRASLTPAQRTALTKAEAADQKGSDKALAKLPSIVVATMSAPYALGQALTEAAAAKGQSAVNQLFTAPPTDDSVLLNPLSELGQPRDVSKVSVPATKAGEKKFNTGQIGAVGTYLMLAQRLPLRDALAAADAWNGDADLGFYRGSTACGRVNFATADQAGQSTLLAALRAWNAKGTGTRAVIGTSGNLITLESCDPGKKVKLTKDAGSTALQLVATRAFLGVEIMKAGIPPQGAQCVAQGMVKRYSLANLENPTFGANDPAVIKTVRALSVRCAQQLS